MEKFEIGTQYKDRKTGIIMTITDVFTVYNSKNEIVRIFYSATGMHGNIPVTNGEVPHFTVQRGLIG